MKANVKKAAPTWSDVKAELADFDRAGLLALVQDLYSSSKDNQAFLHARFGLGGDTLKPYKTAISRWLWPDIFKGQDTSVAKAKKAIADYKKAIGRPDELAELMTFYCEQAMGFSCEFDMQDESYLQSLVGMFSQTLAISSKLSQVQREIVLGRLEQVQLKSRDLGYGVDIALNDLLADFLDSC